MEDDLQVTWPGPPEPHHFRLVGGPLDSNAPPVEPFAALGHAAAAWARLEQQIDMVLIHINKPTYSEQLYRPKHPISFSAKIELMKRWFNQHPPLTEMADDMRALTSRLATLAKDRNMLLHSIVEDWDAANRTVTLNSIKYEGESDFKLTKRAVPLDLIKAFTRCANTANLMLSGISRALFTPDAVKLLGRP